MFLRRLGIVASASIMSVSVIAIVSSPQATADTPAGGVFVPVTPTRVYTGSNGNMATPAAAKTFKVLGVAGIPTSGVSAVVVDVAAQSTTGATNVYTRPDPTSPGSSMLTVGGDNSWRSNTAIVRPNSSGNIAVVTNNQPISFNVDVQGYFTTSGVDGSGGFVPLTPTRLVRTDTGLGIRAGKLQAQTTYTSQIAGLAGIPEDAIAVFANVRLWDAANDSMFKVGAAGTNVAGQAKSVDYESGRYTDSGLTIQLGSGTNRGKIAYWLNSGSVHVQIDVQGYFTAAGDVGGGFTPVTPTHVYDSRSVGALAAGEEREVPISGLADIPADGSAAAVAMAITAMNWTGSGVAGVWDADLPSPNGTSNIGFSGPYAAPVQATSIVAISGDGTVKVKNYGSGPVHILLSAQGWFSVAGTLEDEELDDTEESSGSVDVSECPSGEECDPVLTQGSAPEQLDSVKVFVNPPQEADVVDEEADLLALDGASVSIDANDFAVRVDPESVPSSFVNSDGLVDLLVVAEGDGDEVWTTNTTALVAAPTATAAAEWVDPSIADLSDWEGGPATPNRPAGTVSVRAVIPPSFSEGPGFDQIAGGARVQASSMTPTTSRPPSTCRRKLQSKFLATATVATSYPVNGGSAQYILSQTKSVSTALGTAVSTGPNVGLVWNSSGTNSLKRTFGADYPWYGKGRAYTAEVEYGRYRMYCKVDGVVIDNRHVIPIRFTGGVDYHGKVTRPNWKKCSTMGAGITWYRNESGHRAYTNSAGVKVKSVIGIDLSTKRGYSTIAKMAYKHPKRYQICGNNDVPAEAGKIMQKLAE